MKNNKSILATYMAPTMTLHKVLAEQGFAVTGNYIEPVGGRNEEQEW